MEVAVIIPCYNVVRYVGTAIESVLRQETPPKQLLLVDNNSTDGTLDLLTDYADRFPALIQVLSEKNQGAPSARNKGLAHATTPWVQFLDADDWIRPQKISICLDIIRKYPGFDVLIGAYTYRYLNGRSRYFAPRPGDPFTSLIMGRLASTSAILWKRDRLVEIGGWKEELTSSQEYDLLFRLLCHGAQFHLDKEPLTIICRRMTGQISFTDWGEVAGLKLKLLLSWYEWLGEHRPAWFSKNLDFLNDKIYEVVYSISTRNVAKANSLLLKHLPAGYRPWPSKQNEIGLLHALMVSVLGFKNYAYGMTKAKGIIDRVAPSVRQSYYRLRY